MKLFKRIKNFLLYRVLAPIDYFLYWVKCHTLKSHRFHLLDLRQPKTHYQAYRYGFLDTDYCILYACFNLLTDYVKHHNPNLLNQHWIDDYKANYGFDRQAIRYQIAHDLYIWWNKTRQTKLQEIDRLCKEWHATANNQQLSTQFRTTQLDRETALAKETQEKLEQLISIRESLW